jgi:hypothetical protein
VATVLIARLGHMGTAQAPRACPTLERLSKVFRALLGGLLWMIGAIVRVLLLFVIVWFWVSVFFLSARPAESAEPLVGLLTLLVVCVFSCWLLHIKQKCFPRLDHPRKDVIAIV